MRPEALSVSDDHSRLVLNWPGGAVDELPAALLRENARDAASVAQREDSGVISAPCDLTIVALQKIGGMGVNIAFSDGHDRAIYPWRYLREIASGRR